MCEEDALYREAVVVKVAGIGVPERWEEDDVVRPERNELYNRTLDQFLYPYLFHGSDEKAASRGLWSAVEVYLSANDRESALARANDIVILYPGSNYAARARTLLEEAAQSAPPAGVDPQGETAPDEENESTRDEQTERTDEEKTQ